ncbi:MAG: hypothetical protein ACOYD4_16185 [Solirubrobacterales bacterium]
MAPWKLPVLVIAIAVPTVAAFYLGGPGVGVAIGALVAVAIVVVAVRARPRGAIGEQPTPASRRRLLLVTGCPVEDPAVIARIAAEAGGGDGRPAEVLVLAPARIGFLDRWASDLEGARRRAQQNLVITVASLAKAGVAAEARVGDEDLVQAVEDAVQSFAATEVILVTAGEAHDSAAADAARELEARLRAPFLSLQISDPAAR